MPGEPFTWVSMAVVVVCSTVAASAPVKRPVMFTVGGVMSGYWATGRVSMAMMPTSTITMEITMAVTGRLIKVSAIMQVSLRVHGFTSSRVVFPILYSLFYSIIFFVLAVLVVWW